MTTLASLPSQEPLTAAQRRTLLLAAVVMESGPSAVPAGDGREADDELAVAHAMARRLSSALDGQVFGIRQAAAALREVAGSGAA